MFANSFSNYYKTAIFIIMAILTIVFIGRIADIAIMFFAAFIIAASTLPLIEKLKKFMPRTLAVVLILLLVLIGVLLVFIPLGIITINQTALLFEEAPKYIDQLKTLLGFEIFGHKLSDFINFNTFENFGSSLSTVAADLVNRGLNAGKVIANSITSILAVSIMVFYLCVDEEHMKKAYLAFFPPKFKTKAKEVLDILTSKVGGYVLAQVLSMIGIGVLTFLGLLIIRHPQALLVGFITFVTDLIPVVGAFVAVLLGIVTAHEGGIGYMVLTLAVMMIAQWLQNQILRPVLFSKFMDMHPLLIIVSLLIGAKFLGFTGVVLGPAFASLVCVLVNELYLKQINNDGK